VYCVFVVITDTIDCVAEYDGADDEEGELEPVYFLQFFLLNMKWWKIVKKTAQNMKFIIF
jgi:hypothetical protein